VNFEESSESPVSIFTFSDLHWDWTWKKKCVVVRTKLKSTSLGKEYDEPSLAPTLYIRGGHAGDVIQSITKLVQDLHCDGIVMVAIENKEALLRAQELKRLLTEPPASLVLIRLPANQQEARAFQLGASFLSLLLRLWRYKADVGPMESTQAVESITQVIAGGK
jgi:hypothetical protein